MSKLIKYSFSELYDMSSGISSTPEQAGHGAPFASFSTVFNNYFLPDVLPDLMSTSDKEQVTYSIKKDDILLTRTSETIDELAFSCVAIKDYPTATYSGFTKRLRPNENGKKFCYSKYLAFYLRGYLFRKLVTNNAFMTLRASFNETIFSFLYLLLPDYHTQVKIGDFLYTIEEKIKLNKRINAELEAMAKTLYDYWFVQFDFPNKDGKPYKSSGSTMQYNEELKRDIPEGWTNGTLANLGDIVGGSTPSTKNENNFTAQGTAWVTPNDLSENKGNKFIGHGAKDVTDAGIKEASLKKYPAGTVLLSSRAPVGYMAIARNELTTNQGFKSFIPNKEYPSEFIFYAVKHMLPIIEQNASGSTFKEISASTLKNIKVPLPNSTLIEDFTTQICAIFKKQNAIEIENQELAKLRDWLLPMLMNGQVKKITIES